MEEVKSSESLQSLAIAELSHIEAPDFARIYSNNASLSIGFYDITLIFGQVIPKFAPQTPVIDDRVAVIMSPEHVKALHTILGEHLASYERSYGSIRVLNPTSSPNAAESPSR